MSCMHVKNNVEFNTAYSNILYTTCRVGLLKILYFWLVGTNFAPKEINIEKSTCNLKLKLIVSFILISWKTSHHAYFNT